MTIIAVPETPTITCPPWCRVTQDEHVADLEGLEGLVIHWSHSQHTEHAEGEQRTEVRVTRLAYVDGTRSYADGPADLVFLDDTGLTVDQARTLIAHLTAAIAEVEA